jgi:uncharacterized membrane protein
MFPAVLLAAFNGHDLGNALFRWAHIVAGVLWIGHLYFFNFVNAELAKTYDADSKKKVIPELMPRALYWFRWGAAWTWITGLLLLLMLYWSFSSKMTTFFRDGGDIAGEVLPQAAALGIIVIGFAVYDQIAKALAKQPMVALWIWYLIAIGFAWILQNSEFFQTSHRATMIHVGALLGTAMAANVWMKIWPAQKRIITAIKAGQAPNPADAAIAGMRSKHNTFMSVPLLMLMLSVHGGAGAGVTFGEPWMWVLGLCAVGFVLTQRLYTKAGQVKGF